jgi:hypothetical protein
MVWHPYKQYELYIFLNPVKTQGLLVPLTTTSVKIRLIACSLPHTAKNTNWKAKAKKSTLFSNFTT